MLSVNNFKSQIEQKLQEESSKIASYELLVSDCLKKIDEKEKKIQDYDKLAEVMKRKITEQKSTIVKIHNFSLFFKSYYSML
jgi:flagellar biosynthesis chaperone FliJ